MDKAVGHRVLTVAGLALGTTQAGVVRKVFDGQLYAVGGGAEESVDEFNMGIALVGAECDVGACKSSWGRLGYVMREAQHSRMGD